MSTKRTQPVHVWAIAKHLLKQGYELKSVKADKNDPEHKKVVFYFEYTDGIKQAINEARLLKVEF